MIRCHLALCCLLCVGLPSVGCDSSKSDAKTDGAKKGDGKKDEGKKDGAKSDTPKKDDAVLKLGDAKLFEKDDPKQAMVLAADGSVSVEGKKVGTIGADGKLTLTDGKLVLEVKPNGDVMVADKVGPLKLEDAGGTITMGEKSMTFAFKAGGVLEMNPPPDNPGLALAHEGCDAIPKTCAVALFALLSPGEVVEGSPEGIPADADDALPPAAVAPPPVPAEPKK